MIGILITNIGSPDAATPAAVRKYLKNFLSDSRVVEIPKAIWYPILYGYILPFRSRSSAKLYQKIWTTQGSPLVLFSKKIAEKLQQELNIPVVLGMHYGNPSIANGLEQLRKQHVKKIIVLPMYPQYSGTTTASTFDLVAKTLKSWRDVPELYFIHDYATHPAYINAITNSIEKTWQEQGKPQHLLFSFHGIPKRNIDLGDPYAAQCQQTASLVAEKLQLKNTEWSVAFQSRLGRAEWLKPYTDQVLAQLPKQGIKHIHVICPGFSVDCLETLEEIAIRGKEQFIEAGGDKFLYIQSINDSEAQIKLFSLLTESQR